MPKRFWVFTFIVFVLTAPTVPAFADSTSVSPEKLAAAALNQFGGTAAMVAYLNYDDKTVFLAGAGSGGLGSAGSVTSASTFVVNSTGNGSDLNPGNGICATNIFPPFTCTFLAAIQEANAHAGLDVINFSISFGVQTITPASPLPTITDQVIIDGATQPSGVPGIPCIVSGHPCIELNGASAGASADGLHITAGSSTVSGLVINRFDGDGIELATAGGNDIRRNFIGTDVTGTAALGNGGYGVYINTALSNTIGGTAAGSRNIISRNNTGGIWIQGGNGGNLVQGNFIGTNSAGTSALGNFGNGVLIDASPNNTIGGTTAAELNVISGNTFHGVKIVGSAATGNQVQGNFIGTDVTGTVGLGNFVDGVRIIDSPNNTIGGTTAGAGNVISGNSIGFGGGNGVGISGSVATGNQVQGNFIGTDATGTVRLGNSADGVLIGGSPNNTIGGTSLAARNVISGNFSNGVQIFSLDATGNQVQGNFIGTDATGTVGLGNSSNGVFINGAPNNTIGGTTAAARNIISGNGFSGVEIFGGNGAGGNQVLGNFIGTDATGTVDLGNLLYGVLISGSASIGNQISLNSIFSNSLLGIDLIGNRVTPNDAGDGDIGPNNLQNFPVLNQAFGNGSTTTILGMFNSYASAPFTIEFFSNDSCDASGYGEGQTYIGSDTVTTDGSGNANINVTFPIAIPTGKFITATATDSAGNTSEFCQCETVVACAAAKGDMNASGGFSPADAVSMLNCVFMASGNCALCFADVNCSGDLTSSDVVLELNAVFLGQTAPPWCGN